MQHVDLTLLFFAPPPPWSQQQRLRQPVAVLVQPAQVDVGPAEERAPVVDGETLRVVDRSERADEAERLVGGGQQAVSSVRWEKSC